MPGYWCWSFGEVRFDEAARSLTVRGAVVDIENRPLALLRVLLLHAGEVLTKAELLEAVWPGRLVVEAALSNAVAKLRRAIGDTAQTQLETVHGVGYKLAAEVRREWVERMVPPAWALQPGQTLPQRPRWPLVRCLAPGRGRQVWLAEHEETGERRVFKLAADAQGLASLRREVTLSRLLRRTLGEHAGLLRVLDWSFEREPYFIETEHFGVDLLEWADGGEGLAAVPLAQRLEIAARLADILADAHSAGVLHKDIKPANVLIAGDARAPALRLADFGSGELLDPEVLAALNITRAGFAPDGAAGPGGTLLYLAPELLHGAPPTTASDIYALGILLFQLCAGDLRRPMAGGWEQLIDDELLREDLVAATHGEACKRPASARELAQRLRALPQRREALRQARAAEAARQQALRQLERERARRPWRIATTVALGAGLLLACGLSWQALHARGQALREAARASAVVHFLRDDLLAAANPRISGRAQISLREVVDAARPMIAQRFAAQPGIAAELEITLAEVYHQLSDFAAAERAWRAALARAQDLPAAERALAARAGFGLAETLSRTSQFAAAQEALRQGRENLSDAPELRLLAARAEAVLAFARSDDAAAEATLRAALADPAAVAAAPLLAEDLRIALGEVLARRGRHDEGQSLLRQAVVRLGEALGERHPRTLGARHALGRALQLARREAELQPLYELLVADLRSSYGADSEYTALAEQGLSNVYYKLQRWERQIPLSAQVLQRQHERFGTRSLQTLGAAIAHSAGLLAVGDGAAAQQVLERYLPAARDAFGAEHLVVFVAELNYVAALVATGAVDEASVLLRSMEARIPAYCRQDADCRGELALQQGRVLAAQGHTAQARRSLEEAIPLLLQHNAEDFWTVRQARETLASLPTTG